MEEAFTSRGCLAWGGQDQGSGDDQGSPHVLPRDLLVVVQGVGVHHHLEVLKAGAVVELDEGEGLHVPDGAEHAI